MNKVLLVAAVLILLVFVPSVVSAQNQSCAPREIVIERLIDDFGERRQSVALGANNTLFEVWANTDGENPTGSWTITVTRTNGITCVFAAGQNYETVKAPKSDPI